jgi:hypothetical protein
MRAVLPLDLFPIKQSDKGFVDQRSRLQDAALPFAFEIAVRQPMQFLVHERRQLFERIAVALFPSSQQLRDVLG